MKGATLAKVLWIGRAIEGAGRPFSPFVAELIRRFRTRDTNRKVCGSPQPGLGVVNACSSARQDRLAGRLSLGLVLTALIGFAPNAESQRVGEGGECGALRGPGQFGPYDYRTATREQIDVVEVHHFDREYRALSRGVERIEGMQGNVAAGLDYTLRALPNHPRALEGMERISVRRKLEERLPGANWRVECYFMRAIAFTPDDGIVRALYGLYLSRRKRGPEAELQLAEAERLARDDPNALIQIAAAYFELGRYPDAQRFAQLAYDNGYPLYGLRERMVAMGKWQQ